MARWFSRCEFERRKRGWSRARLAAEAAIDIGKVVLLEEAGKAEAMVKGGVAAPVGGPHPQGRAHLGLPPRPQRTWREMLVSLE